MFLLHRLPRRAFTTATSEKTLAAAAPLAEPKPKFHEGPILFTIVFGAALAFNYVMVQKWAPAQHKEELEKRLHVTDPNAGPAHLSSMPHGSQPHHSHHPGANAKV